MTKRTAIIIAASIATLAVGGCGILLALMLIGASNDDSSDTTSNVVITSCDHRDGETRIGFKVTNDTVEATSYRLRFEVRDKAGKTLSRGDEYVRTIDPGHSRDDAITLKYVGTGATCEYVGEAP